MLRPAGPQVESARRAKLKKPIAKTNADLGFQFENLDLIISFSHTRKILHSMSTGSLIVVSPQSVRMYVLTFQSRPFIL
jgi:hypothetical protein